MGPNAASEIARRFNERTAHSPRSIRTSGHTLDWDVKPFPFKVYTDAPAVALPRELDPVTAPVLDDAETRAARPLTLDGLATLLYYTAGVTKKKTYPGGGEVLFRAAASTGALYQTEVYVAAGRVTGLDPGLYHFCPGDFTLRRLRPEDVREPLAEAAADERLARRAATLILTAIYWRNTWKYQARGYRHLFWDSGTMLANLLAVGRALELEPRLVTGFVDARVNGLLGLDPEREAALELVGLGPDGARAPAPGALEPLEAPVLPLSTREVDYPALREIHRASMLETPGEVDETVAAGLSGGRASGPRRRRTEPRRSLPRGERGRGTRPGSLRLLAGAARPRADPFGGPPSRVGVSLSRATAGW